MKKPLERVFIAGFGIALLLLYGISVAFHQSNQRLLRNQLWSEHTHQVLEALGSTINKLDIAERGRQGYAATSSSRQNTSLIVSVCYGLSFILLFGVYFLLQKQIHQRNKDRDELEIRVQERTAELTKINLSLQAEIAERIRIELELQQSEDRFRRAILNSPFPLILHAEDGEVLLISKAWTDLTGYAHSDIPTIADWTEKAYGERKDLVQEGIDRLYSLDRSVSEGEYVIKTSNNDTRIWDFSSAPVGISEGKRLVISVAMDVTERKRAEAQIKASLQEKEVLLKEIHHRVKNNLQIISSLLNLQAGYLHDPQAIELFKVSQSRITSMALIHEKLYQSKDLAQINLAEYIQDLADSLFSSYEVRLEAITLRLEVDDTLVSLDIAIPCGLIINELVLNSLKHAFPSDRSGDIYIIGTNFNDRELTLTIGDNGIGLPPDFDFKNTESLGLQLVDILTKQLEGTILIDTTNGVEFKITFNLKREPLVIKK